MYGFPILFHQIVTNTELLNDNNNNKNKNNDHNNNNNNNNNFNRGLLYH